jgi:hypothetical protein
VKLPQRSESGPKAGTEGAPQRTGTDGEWHEF